jgi:hypothetical protein
MVGTMPLLIASSFNSSGVQWLNGKPNTTVVNNEKMYYTVMGDEKWK